jgi:predicted acyltransferase
MSESNNRLLALDTFRGATIMLMILVNNPGTWSHIYAPFRHAKWHGCTLTDLVFPFFLLIMGVAMRFTFEKYEICNKYGPLFKKVFVRTITIFILGLILNAFPFVRQDWDWSSLRILGVLQRIALVYLLASIIVIKRDIKAIIKVSISLLFGYWLVLYTFGIINGVDPYALNSNLVLYVDKIILGDSHLWSGNGIPFDPEGLLSTIPAVVTTVIGFLVGTMIKTASDQRDNCQKMAILGSVFIIIGWIWGLLFPINKALWTSSYVLFTAGIGILVLSIMIWLVDIKKNNKWAKPLIIYGTNSIFIFVISGIWTKVLLNISFNLNGKMISGYSYLYQTIFMPLDGGMNSSLLFALFHIVIFWLILALMYKKRVFIKV